MRSSFIGCLGRTPNMDVSDRADADTDRELAESGRHALDMHQSNGVFRRPSLDDVKAALKGAAKRAVKYTPAINLPGPMVVATGGMALPC